jgi:predicted DNA-binding mobile mystery protein A
MDCVFVYSVIPRSSLEETIRKQAERVAKRNFSRTSHSMLLENQQVSREEQQKMLESKVDDLIREMPRDFWREQ